MTRLALIAIALAGCGHAAPAPAPAKPPAVRRACVHAAEPVPSSCIRASARGTLLKDDHDAGLRIWQACDAGFVVDGAYVGERVGNGRNPREANTALFQAHTQEILQTGAVDGDYAACGGDAADHDDGCIVVRYQPVNEDVPGVMRDLLHVFATNEDLCLPFRIETGVAGPALQ